MKPWVPNTPLHCYDFTTCAFWVQVFGLPRKLHSIRLSYSLLAPHSPNQQLANMEVSSEQHIDRTTAPILQHSTLDDYPKVNVAPKLKSPAVERYTILRDSAEGSSKIKILKSPRKNTKESPLKKAKRYNPYGVCSTVNESLDESHLMDTPIFATEGVGSWAVVACPNKPPSDKWGVLVGTVRDWAIP